MANVLGIGPILAVSDTLVKAVAISIAFLVVLVLTSVVVSAVRYLLPSSTRIPACALILAMNAAVLDLLLRGYFFELSQALGIYVSVLAANTLAFNRIDTFASRRSPLPALVDAAGFGLGLVLIAALLGVVRELMGHGSLLSDIHVIGGLGVSGAVSLLPEGARLPVLSTAAGAFLTLGVLIALRNAIWQTAGHIPSDSPPSSGFAG
jgi:electron transport complex protein RnfE